jgi:hypothetical protein
MNFINGKNFDETIFSKYVKKKYFYQRKGTMCPLKRFFILKKMKSYMKNKILNVFVLDTLI